LTTKKRIGCLWGADKNERRERTWSEKRCWFRPLVGGGGGFLDLRPTRWLTTILEQKKGATGPGGTEKREKREGKRAKGRGNHRVAVL